MGLEAASFISQLDSANPLGTDQKLQGDDHLRLIKAVLLASLPNINAAMTLTSAQLNAIPAQIAAIPTIATGQHTPSVAGATNISSVAAFTMYIRVGVYVICFGQFSGNATSAWGFIISLPIATNLTEGNDLVGGGVFSYNEGAPSYKPLRVDASPSTDTAIITSNEVVTDSITGNYWFMYEIK